MFSSRKKKGKKGKAVGLEDFDVLALVGKGAYGSVYRVKDSHGKIFAMKVLRKEEVVQHEYVKHVNTEREILAELSSAPFFTGKKNVDEA